jgi:hypothetical protein
MTANRRRPGTTSRKISSRLPARSGAWFDRPVTLPPGRARLATYPLPTGSFAVPKTIGMTDVVCIAARTPPPDVTMTSTFSRTNSAAISVTRSSRPSAQRYSIATVRPSLQPSSRSRCTKATVHRLQAEGVAVPSSPMVGRSPACCARAASGHAAAAPPRTVMNSRRFMSDVRIPDKSPAMGTHRARATLASRSCARWQGSPPKATPSGTNSAGVGRNRGAGARFPPVPCRTPAAPPPAMSNRSVSRSADRTPAGVDCRSRPWS